MRCVVVCFDGLEAVAAHGPFSSYVAAADEADRLQRALAYEVQILELQGDDAPQGWVIAPENMVG